MTRQELAAIVQRDAAWDAPISRVARDRRALLILLGEARDALAALSQAAAVFVDEPGPDGIGDEEQYLHNHPEWPDDDPLLARATAGDLRLLDATLVKVAETRSRLAALDEP